MIFLGAVLVAAQFMATLETKTLRAFEEYLRGVDAQMTARAAAPGSQVGRTEGVFANSSGKGVPDGMVHDWTAVTFVKGGRKDAAVAILEDFGRHGGIYPEVVEGRTERREGNRIFGFHRLRKKKVLEVTLEAQYQLDRLAMTAGRYASRSVATSIVEVDDAGTPKEKKLPPGRDHGFLWRLQTYWTLEETKDGLWMEVRSVSLTRDVPLGLGWAVKPIVRDLPKESLEGLMEATKRALLAVR
jgi:hypothetical protein